MDRLSQLRGAAGGSGDSTLDTSSPPSEAYESANDGSSKYFSLSEVDSTFDITPIKDVSLASTTADSERTVTDPDELISNLSPISKKSDMLDSYKIGKQIEAANILSGGVDIFDDNDNSYDGDELVIDDNAEIDEKSNPELKLAESEYKDDNESTLVENDDIASKDTEVVLQIDGKHVDAIDIGNGIYLYRKEGQEELAAVQIIDDDQIQPSFKFLKVRENAEGNLEVYEEIEIEVPKEVPSLEGKAIDKNTSHVPIKDINKVINDSTSNKVVETLKVSQKENTTSISDSAVELNKDVLSDSKPELNLNGKMMKFSESRKSPVVSSFTPMAYHSTPNKEGIPLTKTMVNQQLHPSRHSDSKKTIELHTDSSKKLFEPNKKDSLEKQESEITPDKEVHSKVVLRTDNINKVTNDQLINDQSIGINKEDDCANVSKKLKKNGNDKDTNYNQEGIMKALSGPKKAPSTAEVGKINEPKVSEVETEISNIENCKNVELSLKEMSPNDNILEENNVNIDKKLQSTENIGLSKIVSNTTEVVLKRKAELSPNIDMPSSSTKLTHVQSDIASKKTALGVPNETENDQIVSKQALNIDKSINKKIEDGSKTVEEKIQTGETNIKEKSMVLDQQTVTKSSEDDKNKDSKSATETLNSVEIKGGERSQVQSKETLPSNEMRLQQSNTNTILLKDNNAHIGYNNKQDLQKNIIGLSKFRADLKKTEDLKETDKPLKKDMKSLENTVDPKKTSLSKLPSKVEERVLESKIQKPAKISVTNDRDVANSEASINANTKNMFVCNSGSIMSKNDDNHNENKDLIAKEKSNNNNAKEVVMEKDQIFNIEIPKKNEVCKDIQQVQQVIEKKVESMENIEPHISKPDQKSLSKDNVQKVQQVVDKQSEIAEKKESPISKINQKSLNKDNAQKVQKAVEQKGEIVEKELCASKGEQKLLNKDNDQKIQQCISKREEIMEKKDLSITKTENKSLNNNHAPVPFGQWTAANRQEFLNKFKEIKAPVNSTNSKQIKNSNDLNRRDVLKKIDSQRQSSNIAAKAHESFKAGLKNETVFSSKTTLLSEDAPVKPCEIINNTTIDKNQIKRDVSNNQGQGEIKDDTEHTVSRTEKSVAPATAEVAQKKDFFNAQDIIDITVEDMIHRNLPTKHPEENKQSNNKKSTSESNETPYDDIEMKMNELHGIPFVERPQHELPHVNNDKNVSKSDIDNRNKNINIPNLLPFTNKSPTKSVKDQLLEVDSEEEIIEHEPITGDINPSEKVTQKEIHSTVGSDKKEAIITETDFDKFARRNSFTYENCLTVNFDRKESHKVLQNVVEKEMPKKYSNSEMVRFDVKSKLPQKSGRHNTQSNKVHSIRAGNVTEDSSNKQYQSKLQMAYQSALTAKRQLECPITIIEDKPVKVVFIDSNAEYIPSQLNVQGQELSPCKKSIAIDALPEVDAVTTSTCDSLDSDLMDSIYEVKSQDETKIKTKHQRKQVLTPVEAPDIELIQPGDLGIEVSPKKKRKTDDNRYDKQSKNLIHKKSYLLGRTSENKTSSTQDFAKTLKDASNKSETFHREPVSALDSLVKAAELLENQTENVNTDNTSAMTNPDSQQTTPVKRGRGRPRKYPLPEGVDKNKIPSPQKKPRLIDAKPLKRDTTTEEEESSDDDEIVKENWTMGKINENIVCPICNKLFRSENVVFKHVKHCTGVSPNRSDSEKRSPRRLRHSQESESKSEDMDIDDDKPISEIKKETPKKRKSKDSISNPDRNKDKAIIIEDNPVNASEITEKVQNNDKESKQDPKKTKTKIPRIYNLVCEFCGKSFRQHSYLVSHKLQHKKEEKKTEKDTNVSNKSVFTCEVCQKTFRKLHHLVQHRLIHNSTLPSRVLRKSSSEQSDTKLKDQETSKQNEDPSAGFRCEPCDKSFRKLHHLVEHRETHDGINRQKTTTVPQLNVEKPAAPTLECDICKKTFRKLHHLVEHKEQHNETGSDKSDDKSVRSTLSTKDIIHECSLCYMVFPNEHSLNKHTVICERKKRQSKQAKSTEENDSLTDSVDNKQEDEIVEIIEQADFPKEVEIVQTNEKVEIKETPETSITKEIDKDVEIIENASSKIIELIHDEPEFVPSKPEVDKPESTVVPKEVVSEKAKKDITEKNKKTIQTEVKVRETPKKKTPVKDKVAATVTKRKKTTDLPLPVIEEAKPAVDSSDDDEVRYMLNPDFKEEPAEDKLFMKVKAKKRNSLQIERPNSKDLVKRRISLQHPPKIPRMKQKQADTKVASKPILKVPKSEPLPSTDSDDSDVKYSFPVKGAVKTKSNDASTVKEEKKTPRRLSNKRKSLSSIAKRKSLGKPLPGRPKLKNSPVKYVRRRTTEVEHRCDCGQLFSSAALLSRHTSLAHTPPRIRKRRSPPPEIETKPAPKNRKPSDIPKPTNSRKSSVRSDAGVTKSITRKSSASDVKGKTAKSDIADTSAKKSVSKPRRTPAHRGVPVPEKMRKMMQSFKK